MKSCPVCGLIQDESCLFCPEDGSTLTDAWAAGSHAKTAEAKPEERPGAVVLYCPACAAEYPLTFKVCPIHVVPLTKHNLLKCVPPPAQQSPVQQPANSAALNGGGVKSQSLASGSPRITTVSPPITTAPDTVSVIVDAQTSNLKSETGIDNKVEAEYQPVDPAIDIDPPDYLSGYVALANAGHDSPSQDRSHYIVAIALVIGLALFGIAALYTFYQNASRRPASSDSKAASQSNDLSQQAATVYTPQSALDYKREWLEPVQQESDSSQKDERIDNEKSHSAAALPLSAQPGRDDPAEPKTGPTPAARQQPAIPVTNQVSAQRPASATELVLPRGTYGQVDARLLNVRSRKTPNGFRYDLTFNMQEQAGRTTQWERLAVVTRSASGVSHSQAMPFYHRLGAAGTLTFTVSVEMQGRTQPDWAGRIVCTSVGTDQTGKAYRASFGANVTPN